MELPPRAKDDQLLRPGELTGLIRRLRPLAAKADLASVIACAFDHRTRMLPFFYADLRMAPAGARAVGSALADAGFAKTRIVLQHWNRHFRPSAMRLDGRVPDLFLVSSMSLHTAPCRELIRDACSIPPDKRPLIIAGGSMCIHQPWEVFDGAPGGSSADVAVTGEEFVLLSLLEVLLEHRGSGESMRAAFARARDRGALDGIPGLVYARTDSDGRPTELIDTGVQRLLGDLDEVPDPLAGYRMLEPPSRRPGLAAAPLEPGRVRKYSPIASLVLTQGCKFSCEYCPIPGYNQRHLRFKSPERITQEFLRLYSELGLKYFFGTDDNFFNDRGRALAILEHLAGAQHDGHRLGRSIRWGTEVTVHDTLAMREHLHLAHKAGVRALWLGVEDMTGSLVKKGQGVDKTGECFRLLRQRGICPMPMMMHHDAQPLIGRNGRGLLNQVRMLRKAGAVSLQVLMISPSPGSRQYEEAFTSGQVFSEVAGKAREPYMGDGNYVVASSDAKPWRKQANILAAYVSFYNPLRLIWAFLGFRGRLSFKPAGVQIIGMWGLSHTLRRTAGWVLRLARGPIHRQTTPPASTLPMRSPDNAPAAHDAPQRMAAQRVSRRRGGSPDPPRPIGVHRGGSGEPPRY